MAQIFGEKSEYLIDKDYKYRKIAVVGIFFLFIISFFIFGLIFSFGAVSIGASLFFLLLILVLRKYINLNIGNSYKFNRGRKGECEICDELAKLPEEFSIFQDVQIQKGGGNIDFVVVGPAGIFAVEVKSHKGKITFEDGNLLQDGNKFEKNILSQTLSQALNLREYLLQKTGKEFFINPILAFSSPYTSMHFGIKPVTKNIYIIQKRFLNQLIQQNSSYISQPDMNLVINELKHLI